MVNLSKINKIITFCENAIKKTKETIMFIKGWRQGCKHMILVKISKDPILFVFFLQIPQNFTNDRPWRFLTSTSANKPAPPVRLQNGFSKK